MRQFGSRAAVLPTDPLSGGTWLAINDAGLVLAVLNVNPPDRDRGAPKMPRERGEVIPSLVGCDSPSAALGVCERLSYLDFAPFRLVLIGRGVAADVRWNGREPMVVSRLVGGKPQMFTSSGLGDHLVEGGRQELFDEMFAGGPETWEVAQYAFHRHRWPGREHLSVNMSRDTARTVSHTVSGLGPAEAVFTYHADAPDRPADLTTVRLPLAPGAVIPLPLLDTAIGREVVGGSSKLWRWEFWPAWVFYLPVPCFVLLSVRYRGFTVWTVANPGIPAGEVVGEPKADILARLPPGAPTVPHAGRDVPREPPSRRGPRAGEG